MIIVKNRELLIPRDENLIGTDLDRDTDVRFFMIHRMMPGQIDLATFTFSADVKYSNGSTDTIVMYVDDVTDDDIIVRLPITQDILENHVGNLWLQMRASDLAGRTWASTTGCFYVVNRENTGAVSPSTTLTELEQLEVQVQANETLRATAETGRATAETGRANAESARVLAEASRVTAEQQRSQHYEDNTLASEGWAVGKQKGVDVGPGSPYYHNNSKYWSEQAGEVGGAVSYAVAQELNETQKTTARTNIGAYAKPSGGIPSSDMSSAVQTSLSKADTALQSHQDISGKEDKGYLTIGGTRYQLRVSTVDEGAEGYITFVIEE